MGTKRQPLPRNPKARITPEVTALFAQLELTPQRLRGTADYRAGVRQLCRLLQLDFWSMKWPTSVLSAEPIHPAGHIQNQYWAEAWRWRCLLLEASGLQADGKAARVFFRRQRKIGAPIGPGPAVKDD